MRIPTNRRTPLLGPWTTTTTTSPASTITPVSSSSSSDGSELITATLLIPGSGEPIEHGALVFKDAKIQWVGPRANLPPRYGSLRSTHVPVLMPGLWDCHCHYEGLVDVAGGIAGGLSTYLPGANALIGAITVRDLQNTLRAGYTSVRELGGCAGDLRPGVDGGHLVGPNIYSAHAAMSITGGHGDDHTAPITTVKESMYHGGGTVAVCDGPDECVRTVRMLIRRGAQVIKICSTGGVLSLNDDPQDSQFSDEELRAVVEEAARSRRAVAAHAIGKAGIMSALNAGVHTIEHGMYLDEEVADLMKRKGAYLIATQHIVRTISTDYIHDLPPPVRAKVSALVQRSKDSYALAVRLGVNIALGTDMLSSDPGSKLSHGNNANELVYAVEAGMTPLQAIESATANGPKTLGRLAPLSGQLREGYDADFIAVRGNPLDDISILADRTNIMTVWKAGAVCF